MPRPSARIAKTVTAPIDPARERARLAASFASLSRGRQSDALQLVAEWPKLIHALARAGELAPPVQLQPTRAQARARRTA